MKDPRTDDNWRLEEGDNDDDKWQLSQPNASFDDQWSLQNTPADPINSWQPVEYVKPPRPAGSWILPVVITLALLVVLGYAGYRVLPSLLGLEGDPTPTEAMAVVATDTPAAEATPNPQPENPTPLPAGQTPQGQTAQGQTAPPTTEPTVTPTPLGLVNQDFATVASTFGVNARFAPSTDAAVIRILEQGETVFVFSAQGEWLEVFVADTPLTEGQALSGTVGFAAAEFLTVSTRQISEQLQTEVLAYAGKLPTPTPVPPTPEPPTPEPPTPEPPTPAPTAAAPVTTEATPAPSEEGAAPAEPTAQESGPAQFTVTVNAIAGVNVRRTPETVETNIIRLLENATVLPAIGRTEDTAWIQVALPDSLEGWISADFLAPSGDITTLPVIGAATPTPVGPPVTATDVLTSGVEPPLPYTSVIPGNNAAAIIVTVVDGVNARQSPTLDAPVETLVPQGAVLPATGRSSDGQWVQVQLPTGVAAWVFRDTVTATPAVGALPATDGGVPTATPTAAVPIEPVLLPTLTPTPTPAAPAAPAEPTAAPTPAAPVTVTAEVVPFFLPVYAQASSESTTVARLRRGADMVVIGRNAAANWLQVTTADGTTGWVVAGNVRVTGDVGTVPVVE